MIEIFLRTFFMVLLTELGSASQFAIAANATKSNYPFWVWAGGVTALCVCSFIGVKMGCYLQNLKISVNLISGSIMICMGLFFLWKS